MWDESSTLFPNLTPKLYHSSFSIYTATSAQLALAAPFLTHLGLYVGVVWMQFLSHHRPALPRNVGESRHFDRTVSVRVREVLCCLYEARKTSMLKSEGRKTSLHGSTCTQHFFDVVCLTD